MEELRHGDELQNKKEDFYVLWKMARRLEIVVSLFLIVFNDWKNPMRLVVNFLLLLCSSCPRPYSVYIFNEQVNFACIFDCLLVGVDYEFMTTRDYYVIYTD